MQAQASLNIPNHRGDTPLSLLQSHTNSVWIGPKVAEKVKEAIASSKSRNFLTKITRDKVRLDFYNCSIKVKIVLLQCYTYIRTNYNFVLIYYREYVGGA